MIFNSLEYLIFLPLIFILYWFVCNKSLKLQNLLLLTASYVFYGWWDWRFLGLIIFSSFVDYYCGILINAAVEQKNKKKWLILSMLVNLGFLGVFKYFNFFSGSLSELFLKIGYQLDTLTLDIILPVGISFYTFQTMSYTIDVYRGKLKPTKDMITFFSFVSFFPQLVAGPIERATNLLPQFYTERKFEIEKAKDGLRQILWGLFKKIVVADNCAMVVNQVFENSSDHTASALVIGAVFFSFQIYCDFSGYSDIAIGTSRLFGFNLMKNFSFPYFSRDVAEFWRRWHISLSTWFRDYVYIPLGGSKGGMTMKIRNTFAIFLISGLWHGANWTFLAWGFLNALYFLPLLLLNRNRTNTDTVAAGKLWIGFREGIAVLTTYAITVFAWVFFRAASIENAFLYIKGIFSTTILSDPNIDVKPFIFILLLVVIEWYQREKEHGLEMGSGLKATSRWLIYLILIFIILFFGAVSQPFIYFQF